ncbi:MAG: hypothetical protein Greene041662_207 [Candidatus Peregrinibacteria bacterium Greene0416_62]|nr:MAG: hypothetical protein Greene041662_207 [Candidatus Peregrinibacteria bacterium Greene0416_62]
MLGSRAFCVIFAKIGTGEIDDDTTPTAAFRMGGGATTKVGITDAVSYTGENDAEIILAFAVLATSDVIITLIFSGFHDERALIVLAGIVELIVITTPKEWVTGVLPFSRNGDAGITLTFGVFATFNERRTFICTCLLHRDTLRIDTGKMAVLTTTPENGIAVIGSLSGNGDTGIIDTGKVGDAFRIVAAFIRACILHRKTLAIYASKMRITVAATQRRIAIICAIASNGDTSVILAYCVLITADF